MIFYLTSTAVFMLAIAVMGLIALHSESRFRYAVPVIILFAAFIPYITIDMAMGSAKPFGAVPGWTYPDLEKGDITVLGGSPFGSGGVYLMLQDGNKAPVLVRFDTTPKLLQDLKQAMDKQSKANQGNPWGFKIKKFKGNPDQDQSLEDRPSLYEFPPPQPKALQDKPYQVTQ